MLNFALWLVREHPKTFSSLDVCKDKTTVLLGRPWCVCWWLAQRRGSEDLCNFCQRLLLKTLVNYPSVHFIDIILINIGVTPLSHSSKFCFIHSNVPPYFLLKCSCPRLLAVPLNFPFPVPNWFSICSLHVAAVISSARQCLSRKGSIFALAFFMTPCNMGSWNKTSFKYHCQ